MSRDFKLVMYRVQVTESAMKWLESTMIPVVSISTLNESFQTPSVFFASSMLMTALSFVCEARIKFLDCTRVFENE